MAMRKIFETDFTNLRRSFDAKLSGEEIKTSENFADKSNVSMVRE